MSKLSDPTMDGAVCVDNLVDDDETAPARPGTPLRHPSAAPDRPPDGGVEPLKFATRLDIAEPPPRRTRPGVVAQASEAIREAARSVRETILPAPDPKQVAISEGRRVKTAYFDAMKAAGLTVLPPETLRAVCREAKAHDLVPSELLTELRAREQRISQLRDRLAALDYRTMRGLFKAQAREYTQDALDGTEGEITNGSWPEFAQARRRERRALKGAIGQLYGEQAEAIQPLRSKIADAIDGYAARLASEGVGVFKRLFLAVEPSKPARVAQACAAWFRLGTSGNLDRDLPFLKG